MVGRNRVLELLRPAFAFPTDVSTRESRDCFASWPTRAERAGAFYSSAPRDTPKPPPRVSRPALTSAETHKRIAEIVLSLGPLERNALARSLLQRLAIRRNRLLEFPVPLSRSPSPPKRKAKIVLGTSLHLKRNALARSLLQRLAIRRNRLLEFPRPLSRSPSRQSAAPRLFCVVAQSSGTSARGARLRSERWGLTASANAALSPNSSP